MVEELFPDPFLKNQDWTCLWINTLKFYTVSLFYARFRTIKIFLKWAVHHLLLPLIKFVLFKKRNLKLASTFLFLYDFFLNISLVIFYCPTKFHCLVVFTSWDNGHYVYCSCLLNRLWRHKFWHEPYLSNEAVFSTWPESQNKNLNILRTKKIFEMK